MNTRRDLVQAIIDKTNAHQYLEIGIADGFTFKNIQCFSKASVDPNQEATFHMTSDDFFKQNTRTYDVIFIDGLHEKEQVLRDINNSIACLSPKGAIVTHDTLVLDSCQTDSGVCWNAWEAFAHLRITNPNVFMASVILSGDSVGCGIIRHGTQTLHPGPIPVGWDNYVKERDTLMNVMTPEHLLEIMT